jgi:hypothetical protein
VAAGTNRPIRWDRLEQVQQDAVRDLFSKRQWRRVVNAIIENYDHYWQTGEGQEVHDYIHGIPDALGWDEERWEDFMDDNGDVAEALGWYHGKKGD